MFEADDDDFNLTPSSKLSSIFEASSEDNSASLSYRAPKQPKAPDNNAPKAPPPSENQAQQAQTSVILAKVVTLWKLDNGKNVPMGKYMVALIGNLTTNLYDIIVYQDKKNILIRLTLGASLSFFKYPNNFVSFYDAGKQLWNMNFEDLQAKNEFLDYVAKYDSIVIEQVEKNTENVNNNAVKETTSKEKILSRISKMGQPILPKTDQTANISDSESSLSSDSPLPAKPSTSAPRKLKRNLSNQERALAPVCNDNYHHHLMPNNQMMLHNQGLMYPMPDYGFNSFMVAQNAELKANLAEINSKLNSVLGNADKNCNSGEDLSSLKSKIKCQNLKIENLTTDLNRSKKTFEELQRKYMELDDEDVKVQLKEKCQQMTRLESVVRMLKGENEVLVSNKTELNLKIINLEASIDKAEAELKERDKKIEIQNLKLKDFEEYFKQTENVTKENADLTQKLEELLTRQFDDFDKGNNLELDKDIVNKLVKESMNRAYADIMANFDEDESYSFREIQDVLLENLKKTSYTLMNSLLE